MALSKKDAAERQGGTPFIGRIPPGKERGGCKPQNVPNVPSPPKGSDKKLLESALSVAEHLGHGPKLWFYDPDFHCGQIMCVACRKFAGFAKIPEPGDTPIQGAIVTEPCGVNRKDT